jgi:hypothetical protein
MAWTYPRLKFSFPKSSYVLFGVAIVPGGLEKPDMVLTQKATLERTQEWAEKAALLTQVQTTHRTSSVESKEPASHHRSSQQVVETLHSPLSSPSAVNPRDIPLEHRGGTPRDPRDTPRDPRDHSPRCERDEREPGEIHDDRMASAGAASREERRESRGSAGENEITRSRSRDNLMKSDEIQDREHVDRDARGSVSYEREELQKNKDTDRDRKKLSDLPSRELERDQDSDVPGRCVTTSKSNESRQRTDARGKSESRSVSPPVQSKPVRKSSPEPFMDDDAEPGM